MGVTHVLATSTVKPQWLSERGLSKARTWVGCRGDGKDGEQRSKLYCPLACAWQDPSFLCSLLYIETGNCLLCCAKMKGSAPWEVERNESQI
jgi:hypothetical protein